jgi:hypothetical protein
MLAILRGMGTGSRLGPEHIFTTRTRHDMKLENTALADAVFSFFRHVITPLK